MSNTKAFDILAIRRDNNKQFALQVKTTKTAKKKWILGKKNEQLIDDNIFYVFVSMKNLKSPEYHIVPSNAVAGQIAETHRKWLNEKSKNGQKHKDTSIRNFEDSDDKYLNRWDLLK